MNDLVTMSSAVFPASTAPFPASTAPAADPAGLRYEILGSLRVAGGQEDGFISAHKMQVLLAVLLIRSGQVVPVDQLTTEIWGDAPPRRATAAVHVYISQLRKFLGRPSRREHRIVTRPRGYLLSVGNDELDLLTFQQFVHDGRGHARAGRHVEAADAFGAALGLWRGPALSGLRDSPTASAFATWLDEARLECAELMVESNLLLGRHRDLVGFLFALAAEHPLREAFYRQLMIALYRSERQADALKVYRSARQTLNQELGMEPCLALRNLHQAILVADERLYASGGR